MAAQNLILVNPPKNGKVKRMASTKATRSAAAKKAAATRRRNAAKRSAAAKKAAATRKRNARSTTAKRKAATRPTRSTKASRSAAAKKAAATRRRNAAKRSAAGKKAAATRKRNTTRKASTKKATPKRSTKASRSAAAKKAAATRRRNAAKRSAAAKKAAATRKRNTRKASSKRTSTKRKASTKRKTSAKRTSAARSRAAKKAWATRRRNGSAKRKASTKRRRASAGRVQTYGKNLYDSFSKGAMAMPEYFGMAAAGAILMGAYAYLKPVAWDNLNLTGPGGYINSAVSMLPVLTPNMKVDLTRFAEDSLALGTIAGVGYLVSSKKALNLVDPKLVKAGFGLAAGLYTLNFLKDIQTAGVGTALSLLAQGDLQAASNALTLRGTGLGRTRYLGSAHGNNMGNMHALPAPANNYSMAPMGASRVPALFGQMQTANTAALQRGGAGGAFFGTRGGLGSTRVNLF